MHPFARLLVFAALSGLASVSALAQCAPIAGTGCARQLAPNCVTPPQIGTTFNWQCAPCLTAVPPLAMFGTVLTPPVPVPPPIVCTNTPCTLGCDPILILQANTMSIPIPNLRVLVGLTFCIQCACVTPSVPCFTLTQASSVTIMP